MISTTITAWLFFFITIALAMAVDLYRNKRSAKNIESKEAINVSIGWIILAILFNIWIYFEFGAESALAFLSGYLLEKSLSIDNLFVFLFLFTAFGVKDSAKHTVLFYGVIGAIIMRAALIILGINLVLKFSWLFIPFGLFLVITGIKLIKEKERACTKEEKPPIPVWLTKIIPFSHQSKENSFFVKEEGLWKATPLFALLISIETTDLIFAIDSVPAILGITTDPFIVLSSNVFAILGLRSLFLVLEKHLQRFHYLHYSISAILIFIGFKMIFNEFFHIPTPVSLAVIVIAIGIGMGASFRIKNR